MLNILRALLWWIQPSLSSSRAGWVVLITDEKNFVEVNTGSSKKFINMKINEHSTKQTI